MNKKNIDAVQEGNFDFPRFKSYSVDEVLAAGGTTAFAKKLGKDSSKIIEDLKKLPKDAFLTDEEFEAAMETLRRGK